MLKYLIFCYLVKLTCITMLKMIIKWRCVFQTYQLITKINLTNLSSLLCRWRSSFMDLVDSSVCGSAEIPQARSLRRPPPVRGEWGELVQPAVALWAIIGCRLSTTLRYLSNSLRSLDNSSLWLCISSSRCRMMSSLTANSFCRSSSKSIVTIMLRTL